MTCFWYCVCGAQAVSSALVHYHSLGELAPLLLHSVSELQREPLPLDSVLGLLHVTAAVCRSLGEVPEGTTYKDVGEALWR